MRVLLALVALLAAFWVNQIHAQPTKYLVGAGIGDITGQVAEIGFMGYAVPNQKGSGIRSRMYSRAFIVADPTSDTRLVYVSMDAGMGFHMVKLAVVEQLQKEFNGLYSWENVLLSGTHTHSTPGGVGGTALVDITTFGWQKLNFEAMVNGTVRAIRRAHEKLQPGYIKINVGQCDDANANRSPSAYLLNADRVNFVNNTDHDMTVLRFENTQGEELGMISFFAVHGTSLNNTNTLVSGDNKGYASQLFEKLKNPPGTLDGFGDYVAAFGQSNLGDVSPNTKGARCIDTGLPCDFLTSTCNGKNELCIAFGPGNTMYESEEIIGRKQYDAALNLYSNAQDYLSGPLGFRHQFFDMRNLTVSGNFTNSGENEVTCRPAMGYAFAAGTTDGPGDFDFHQNTTSPNPFWAWVSSLLAKPTPDQVACHEPKPILLDVGQIKPIEWTPTILPLQVYRIGQFWILSVPGEFTTMAGRRLRMTVQKTLQAMGSWTPDSHVVIAGLSNSYSHYITTFEEYQQQRYEGASTLYGPNTLAAHTQNMVSLVEALVTNEPVPFGPMPLDMRNHTFNFLPGVVFDSVPAGVNFGDVQTNVASSYQRGQVASAVFWGASPRNDLLTESSFCWFDRFDESNNEWVTVYADASYRTTFTWKRVGVSESACTCTWTTQSDDQAGVYRIRHQGVWKNGLNQQLTPYAGVSANFTLN